MAAGRVTATAAAVLTTLLFSAAGAAPSPTCFDALSLGGFHGLALSRGTVTGFGEGAAGQLDVPPSTAGRTLAVAAGGFFSCALHAVPGSSTNATTVSCWGGSGSAAVTSVPTSVASDGGVRALAAGGYHACAALSNGSAVCWGTNGAGQTSPLPAAVGTSGVASLALGAYHSCAIVGGAVSSVACWGRDDFGQVSGVPAALASGSSGGSSLRLACGGYHCCAWRAGGAGSSFSCWGAAAAGQTTVPAAVAAASNVSAACAGGYFSCAVVSGAAMCWGSNTRGETTVHAAARDGSVAAVACGWYGACALKLDGSLVCWGGDLGVQAAAVSGGQDVIIATAGAAGSTSTSGSVLITSGAVAAGAGGGGGGASGAISITTGAATGTNASSGAIVVATGAASSSSGRRGAISLLAPTVVVEQSLVVGGNLSFGAATLTAADLAALLALAATGRGGSAVPSVVPSAAVTPAAASASASSAPSATATASASLDWVVTTFAGGGASGAADGQGVAAAFYIPRGVAVDTSGTVFVADNGNHVIRKISAGGAVTTLAGGSQGFADGQGAAAAFNYPACVTVDASGTVYVADTNNNRIRKISASGAVTTLAGNGSFAYADGQGTAAAFYSPTGVALDASGYVYVADSGNHRIRKISPSGAVTTLAGSGSYAFADGQGTAASFRSPSGVAFDAWGTLYVADNFNNRIRKISPSGNVTTLAGSGSQGNADGQGIAAAFFHPYSVAVDASGFVYVADSSNHHIRKISPGGAVTTIAGNGSAAYADGQGAAAAFNFPLGITVDASGTLLVADTFNNRIRKVAPPAASATSASPSAPASSAPSATVSLSPALSATPSTSATASSSPTPSATATPTATASPPPLWTVTSLAGNGSQAYADGQGTGAAFNLPHGIAVDTSGVVYVSDYSNHRIRKISASGAVTTVAGSGTAGYADGQGTGASFSYPRGVAVDSSSGTLYVADSSNNRIRKISPSGAVTTLAGSGSPAFADGQGVAAAFNQPFGVAVDSAGVLYVADANNNRIRKISATGAVTTLAGSGTAAYADGQGTAAAFNGPYSVAVDASGALYVSDFSNNRIRKISAAGAVTTLAGNGSQGYADGQGTAAAFNNAWGLAVDAAGNVYVTDRSNNRIRKISPSGAVTTIAGNGTAGYADGQGTAAFRGPEGIAVDSSGTLYVADLGNNRIRKVAPPAAPSASASLAAAAAASSSPAAAASPAAVAASSALAPTQSASATATPTATSSSSSSLVVWSVTTFAGSGASGSADGQGTAATFAYPWGVAVDASGTLYVAEGNKVRKVSVSGAVTTLAGNYNQAYADGQGAAASFKGIRGIAVNPAGTVYVADYEDHRVRKINATGYVTTLAGNGSQAYADGQGTAAAFNNPGGVAVDSSGVVYVADLGNRYIRKISPTGAVTTLAGGGSGTYADGQGAAAAFYLPYGLSVDASGFVYVADSNNYRIRKISPNGTVTTIAGSGNAAYADGQSTAAAFNFPLGIAVDSLSGTLYISDNNRIRKITASGAVTTLAGNGTQAFADGQGTATAFNQPWGIALDSSSGALYVADQFNNRIRKIVSSP